MNNLLLHPQTEASLRAFVRQPSHAVIISGAAGSGKLGIATWLGETLLGLSDGGLSHYPYAKLLEPAAGKSIGIEAVRELEHFLSLKVPQPQTVNRVVIIADGQLLTTEAQNALLKTIEEPPAGTVLIITTVQEQSLLPTIRSRGQGIFIKKPDHASLEAYFSEQGFDASAISRALAISGDLPGLARALLADETHPLRTATEVARSLLSQSAFERLARVDELAANRSLCLDLLFIMQQMAHIRLATKQTNQGSVAKQWQAILTASYFARNALVGSAQPKLVLCDLFLKI